MHQFADYWLEAELARGGMGVVYRARHMHTGRPCALKLVLSGNRATAAQLHRFKREALAQAALEHPHILRIYDGGEFQGNLYFAMELAEGGDLDVALEWSLPRKVELLAKLARALGYAHAEGYVHRDLKPANVLLTPEGEPKLTDFGLTKRLDSTTMLTQEGALMGTPYYMSPEQAQGHGSTVGPTSDVFSLGVLLYQFVTGELPFAGETTVQLLSQIIDADPPPFSKHDIHDPGLELIVNKALEKDPADRYPQGTAVAEDLDRWLRGDDPTASRASSLSKIARKAAEHKTAASMIVLMISLSLLVVGAIGGVVAYAFAQAEQEAALQRWRVEARGLARSLEAEVERGCDRLPSLIDAREQAAAHLEGDLNPPEVSEDEDRAALRAALSVALRAEVEGALRLGTRGALEHAQRACAQAATFGESPELTQLELRLLAAQAEAGAGPWGIAAALWGSGEAPADEALEAAIADPAAGPAVRRALGARQAREGRVDEAERTWEPLLKAADVDALGALARVAWASGARPLALRAWTRALQLDASNAAAAYGLARCAPRLGEFDAGYAALASAADAEDVQLAQLLLASERDPELLAELPRLTEASRWALVAGDLAQQPTDSPFAEAKGLSGRAAHARWLAEHEQADAARAFLAELALLEGGPRPGAEPAPALIRRALRDLAGAHAALDATEPALAALEAAARSDPGDLEVHALRARLAPGEHPEFAEAARVEFASLESALARGVFVARAARANGIQNDAAPPHAGAPDLIARGTLGRPALRYLLGPLAKEDPAPLAAAWVPIQPRVSSEQRQAAVVVTQRQVPDGPEKLEIYTEAVGLDPHNATLRYELARKTRYAETSLPCYLELVRAVPLAPYSTLWCVIEFRECWGLTASGSEDPSQATQDFLDEDPDDVGRLAVWAIERYYGVLYPDEEDPAWSESTPEEVLRALDRVLGRDSRYYGLLFLRAHMLEAQGKASAADRDLKLVFKLGGEHLAGHTNMELPWGDLYHAWILTMKRPDEASEKVSKIAEIPVNRKTTAGRVVELMTNDRYFGKIGESGPVRRLRNSIKEK